MSPREKWRGFHPRDHRIPTRSRVRGSARRVPPVPVLVTSFRATDTLAESDIVSVFGCFSFSFSAASTVPAMPAKRAGADHQGCSRSHAQAPWVSIARAAQSAPAANGTPNEIGYPSAERGRAERFREGRFVVRHVIPAFLRLMPVSTFDAPTLARRAHQLRAAVTLDLAFVRHVRRGRRVGKRFRVSGDVSPVGRDQRSTDGRLSKTCFRTPQYQGGR